MFTLIIVVEGRRGGGVSVAMKPLPTVHRINFADIATVIAMVLTTSLNLKAEQDLGVRSASLNILKWGLFINP